MTELPINPSPSTIKRNPHLYPPLEIDVPHGTLAVITAQPAAKEVLNKTERRYLTWLRHLGDDWVGIQCMKFQLADKCWFMPDFIAIDKTGMRAIDVKAKWKTEKGPHVEDDALVKIKVASRLYGSWCRFVLAWEEEGVWRHKEIINQL